MPDTPTMSNAQTAPEVLEAVTRFEWYERHSEDCPPNMISTPEALAEFLTERDGLEVKGVGRWEAVQWRLMSQHLHGRRITQPALTATSGVLGMVPAPPRVVLRQSVTVTPPARFREGRDGIAEALALDLRGEPILDEDEQPAGDPDGNPEPITVSSWEPIEDVHKAWLDISPNARPRHPLASLVKAWQERPATVKPETRKDRAIIPALSGGRITETRPERQRGELFGGLLDGRDPTALTLPLYPEAPTRKRVALLEFHDSSGLTVMSQGRGAPLESRFLVRTPMTLPPKCRGQSARMAVRVRELRDGLFPNGWNSKARDWPKIEAVLQRARDFTLPDATGGRWFPFALRRLPSERPGGPDLDDIVLLDIELPPGLASGPGVDLPEFDRLSVESAPRWRAYIAALSLAWDVGNTRLPVAKARRVWTWTRDLARYPVITASDRRRLAFGEADKMHRTKASVDAAWNNLPGLVVLKKQTNQKTGETGWRLVPAEAGGKVSGGE